MSYKMYKQIKDQYSNMFCGVVKLNDNSNIPNDPQNRDYAEYLEWVAAGNEPLPADAPTE